MRRLPDVGQVMGARAETSFVTARADSWSDELPVWKRQGKKAKNKPPEPIHTRLKVISLLLLAEIKRRATDPVRTQQLSHGHASIGFS